MTRIPLPHSLSDVTPAWLTAALSSRGDAIKVADLTLQQIGTGQAGSTYRVTPVYAGSSSQLPDTVIVKLPAEDPALRAGLSLGYRSEVAFYATVAPRVNVPVPQCFYHDISGDGADFVLLLSDLDPAVQGDQIGGCTTVQAEHVMAAIAGLHGPSWCDPDWMDVPEFMMPKPGDVEAAQMMGAAAEALIDVFLNRLGEHLDPHDHDILRASMAAVTPWLITQPRYSLMHGDFRADNLMFHPTGNSVTIVDWQTISVGLPGRDVAYFTASSLQTDVRRATEDSLIDHYHAALLRHGVTGYDRETCWHDYRIGMLQPPLISILGCATATPTERGDAMFVQTLKRSCAAIRDLRTLELIEADARTA